MDTQEAREVAQKHLKTARSPLEKINAVNRTITELLGQNFLVTCPVSGLPLKGVSVRGNILHYHLL